MTADMTQAHNTIGLTFSSRIPARTVRQPVEKILSEKVLAKSEASVCLA